MPDFSSSAFHSAPRQGCRIHMQTQLDGCLAMGQHQRVPTASVLHAIHSFDCSAAASRLDLHGFHQATLSQQLQPPPVLLYLHQDHPPPELTWSQAQSIIMPLRGGSV